jgi:hypothetical protein
MKTLGEEYPREQARCRELLVLYEGLGPGGVFGAAILRATLKEADEAAMSGDLPRMSAAFQDMKARE